MVGHSLENDFKALLLAHPFGMTRDTAKFHPLQRKKNKPHSLKWLARTHLGVSIQTGEHDPVSVFSPLWWPVLTAWLSIECRCTCSASTVQQVQEGVGSSPETAPQEEVLKSSRPQGQEGWRRAVGRLQRIYLSQRKRIESFRLPQAPFFGCLMKAAVFTQEIMERMGVRENEIDSPSVIENFRVCCEVKGARWVVTDEGGCRKSS